MKVKVLQPFQVANDGVVYGPGESADVPDHVAREWIASGWCSEVKPKGVRP
jgi:hypothetical protein